MAASASVESDHPGAQPASRPRIGHVRVDGFVLPEFFPKIKDQIRKMDILQDDVWVCSLPRSGTRWVQEAIWCIVNNVDLELAEGVNLEKRFPFLERSAFRDYAKMTELPEYFRDSVGYIQRFTPPRFVKTHLPLALLPENLLLENTAKVVYVTRNPRDTCISMYHHSKRVGSYEGEFEPFCELFLKGETHFLPYWDHVFQFWGVKNNPNILFIMYEEMKKDLRGGVLKIASFFGKTLTEDQLSTLTEHLSFENMKKNATLNGDMGQFKNLVGANMRSGQSGQWKDVMSQAMVQRFEEWEREHLQNTDYPLVYPEL